MTTDDEQRPKRKVVFLDPELKPVPDGKTLVIGRLTLDPDGRLDGSIRIGRKQFSLFHRGEGEVWVFDLASTNGTTLNGVPLPPGEAVRLDLSRPNMIVASKVPGASVGIKAVTYSFPPGTDPKQFVFPPGLNPRRLPIPVGIALEQFLAGVAETDYFWIVPGSDATPVEVAFTFGPNLGRTAEHTVQEGPAHGDPTAALQRGSTNPPPAPPEGRGPDASDNIA